jgi:hypothetical protein
MALNLQLRIRQTILASVPGDVSILITAYLQDTLGVPFVNSSTGAVDTFLVQTGKSSLPPSNYATFLTQIAQNAVTAKYTTTQNGTTNTSDIITGLTSTADLFPQMGVSGDVNIQADTFLLAVRDATSIRLSQITLGAGTSVLTFTPSNWNIDYSELTHLTTIINFGAL